MARQGACGSVVILARALPFQETQCPLLLSLDQEFVVLADIQTLLFVFFRHAEW